MEKVLLDKKLLEKSPLLDELNIDENNIITCVAKNIVDNIENDP
jgi:hypothetical protein